MNEFERQVYADMESTDRISIWIIKCMELAEFSCILTDAVSYTHLCTGRMAGTYIGDGFTEPCHQRAHRRRNDGGA